MRILYIEDDRWLSETLGEFFEYTEGWEVVRAFGPGEAIEALERDSRRFDAIVLDIMMPPDHVASDERSNYGQDTGILLLDKLDRMLEGVIPVVVLSARQNLEWLEDTGRVDAYLRKTLSPEDIMQGIRDGVEKHRQRAGDSISSS